jgi:hypothetical protein
MIPKCKKPSKKPPQENKKKRGGPMFRIHREGNANARNGEEDVRRKEAAQHVFVVLFLRMPEGSTLYNIVLLYYVFFPSLFLFLSFLLSLPSRKKMKGRPITVLVARTKLDLAELQRGAQPSK